MAISEKLCGTQSSSFSKNPNLIKSFFQSRTKLRTRHKMDIFQTLDVVLYVLDRPGYSQSHSDGFLCWMNADNSRHAIHSFSIIYYLLLENKTTLTKGEGSSSVTMLGDFLASSPSKDFMLFYHKD